MRIIILIVLLFTMKLQSQEARLDRQLFDGYEQFKEKSLSVRRTKHAQIQKLIEKLRANKDFEISKLGESIEGRDISLISIGSGSIDILFWSQMHGDEATATMAIFDILNFLAGTKTLPDEKNKMLSKVKLHFIPMLNPDGAEVFKRRNALNIDLNRDALRLQSPEANILKSTRDSLNADFGFNLHDQSRYYNAELTNKPATISYLAPAYNYEKEINDVRANAMKVIVHMNEVIQKYAPGQVGRYSDDFEPRAFGDNIQKWGTSTILIESGGYQNDREKQYIRKLNYMSILSAVFAISNSDLNDVSISEYENIPRNDRKLFDLKIENVSYQLLGKEYTVDLGIHIAEVDNAAHDDFYLHGKITDIGDLSTYFGYQTIDAAGMSLEWGRVHNSEDLRFEALHKLDFDDFMSQGITTLYLASIPEDQGYSPYPINLTRSKEDASFELGLGQNASFVLMEKGAIRYVLVNGFVYDTKKKSGEVPNGIIK